MHRLILYCADIRSLICHVCTCFVSCLNSDPNDLVHLLATLQYQRSRFLLSNKVILVFLYKSRMLGKWTIARCEMESRKRKYIGSTNFPKLLFWQNAKIARPPPLYFWGFIRPCQIGSLAVCPMLRILYVPRESSLSCNPPPTVPRSSK